MRSLRLGLLVVFSSCFTAHAQSPDTTQWWIDSLKTNTLPVVSTIFREGHVIWPVIDSRTQIEGLDPTARRHVETRLGLAETLLQKIKAFEAENENTETNIATIVNTYGPIREAVQARGGYSNYVLADAMDRLMFARICAYLIRRPEEYARVADLLDALARPSITRLPVVALLRSECTCTLSDEDLKSTPESAWMDKVLQQATGTNFTTFLVTMNVAKAGTKDLLLQRDVPMLIFRMAEVQMVYEAILPALIEFLRRGGTLDDIDVRDVTKFKKVMGDAEGRFRCEVLQTRRIYPHHLKGLIEGFSNGVFKAPLYLSVIRGQ